MNTHPERVIPICVQISDEPLRLADAYVYPGDTPGEVAESIARLFEMLADEIRAASLIESVFTEEQP